MSSDLDLKALLVARDSRFWTELVARTHQATSFDDAIFLSTLRRRAAERDVPGRNQAQPLKVALLAGFSTYPLTELLEQFLFAAGIPCKIFQGDYDNYVAEILDAKSGLYAFAPDVVLLIPSSRRFGYDGLVTDAREVVSQRVTALAKELHGLCATLHDRSKADILLANFVPAGDSGLGPLRAKHLGSEWSFARALNLELGLESAPYVRICDVDFLASRRGLALSHDTRAWFESKQLGSVELLVDLAREAAHMITAARTAPKKVLVTDLDNTLWGGVIGDDGLEGIELGDTSPRGEAFKAFQRYLLGLKRRGVLLAVCSKNDLARALEPFEKHPEKVLGRDDFVVFKANWEPKSSNLREIARELNLGVDSLVFVDDNPAEIEIVRQQVPEVTAVLLGDDPATFIAKLEATRSFEPRGITAEDLAKTTQYQKEAERRELSASATDMDAYLGSLEMTATFAKFAPIDATRITQLINKTNQFNLTTRRRGDAEVAKLIEGEGGFGFTGRLADRFGDHGLIATVICEKRGTELWIDTWLMSCRVFERGMEHETLNEIVRIAKREGCSALVGRYVPSPKNSIVKDLYEKLGFAPAEDARGSDPEERVYRRAVEGFEPLTTHIRVATESQ